MENPGVFFLIITLSSAAILLSGMALWQARSLIALKRTFFAGKQGESLEELLFSLARHINAMEKQQGQHDKRLGILEHNTLLGLQKTSVDRFNPFGDGGGNFSFCVAMLDGKDNGFVLTSMYGREQNRVYTKRIENGRCEQSLTGEEQQAISEAQNSYLDMKI